ncbi:MAG: DMT family transporter [Candidatus Weimeria sp.]|nr:DMT family transporter [Candidatus Weimeria sp.]
MELRLDKDEPMKEKTIWEKQPVVILGALFCCFLWGSASPAIKIGYEIFGIAPGDTAGRLLFAGIRFMIAGGMVIGYDSLQKRRFCRPAKGAWRKVAILSVFQTSVHYILFYMGLAYTSGVRGSIINSVGTFFSIFLAVWIFRFEKLTLRKALGSLVGFLGVLICVTGGSFGQMFQGGLRPEGEGALLLSAFCGAMASNLIKRIARTEDPVTMSGWQFLTGGVTLVVMAVFMGGRLQLHSPAGIPLILYMGFISAGAYTVWSVLLKYNPVSTVTVLGFMNPVFGVLLSVVFLREASEAASLAGVAALLLVSVGVVIVNYNPKKRRSGD